MTSTTNRKPQTATPLLRVLARELGQAGQSFDFVADHLVGACELLRGKPLSKRDMGAIWQGWQRGQRDA